MYMECYVAHIKRRDNNKDKGIILKGTYRTQRMDRGSSGQFFLRKHDMGAGRLACKVKQSHYRPVKTLRLAIG
jgi:hypothetical protein